MRLYEGNKENQRALFTDVKSFRDASIPVLEKVVKTQQKRMQKQTANGFKDVIVEARVTDWREPDGDDDDTPKEEYIRLGSMSPEEFAAIEDAEDKF